MFERFILQMTFKRRFSSKIQQTSQGTPYKNPFKTVHVIIKAFTILPSSIITF